MLREEKLKGSTKKKNEKVQKNVLALREGNVRIIKIKKGKRIKKERPERRKLHHQKWLTC